MVQKGLEDVKGLVRVATLETPPDMLIKNTLILDVFAGELFSGNIWVYRSWIAYVGERIPPVAESTVIVDGAGLTAVPGYIDAHGHADLYYNPAAFADFVVTRGATTVFSDAHDMVNSIGLGGFEEVLRKSHTFAVKYLWGVPAAYPPYPEVEGGELYTVEEIRHLFETYRDCVAVSELSSYVRILKNEDSVLEKILLARSLERNVEGHTLGASYDRLNVLVAAGITSCHESIRESDLVNRVRLGLYTMIRHSSIRSDFETLCPAAKALPVDAVILVSDGIFAQDLLDKGYMDFIIREAIRCGMEPARAYKMATINPARYFRRDGDIGSIAPGRIADICLLRDLEDPTPVTVIERGRIKAREGRLLLPEATFPAVGTVHHPYTFRDIGAAELEVAASDSDSVPVIDIVDRTVTRRVNCVLEPSAGVLLPSPTEDIRKIAYTRREQKKWGKGFVRGLGTSLGGIASTIAHETHGLLVVGFSDSDMVLAANEALTIGGGIVCADGGRIIHRLPLPHGATMSDLGITALARELTALRELLRETGSTLDDPVWTLGFLTFTSIVEVRMTTSGIYDVKRGEIIS